MEEVCEGVVTESVPAIMACEEGFSLDGASGMCTNGERKVSSWWISS
jgi:hypothetical protein